MRTIKVAAGLVLCAAVCVACDEDKTVTDKELGFEITFPKSWVELHKPQDRHYAHYKAPGNAWTWVRVFPGEGNSKRFPNRF